MKKLLAILLSLCIVSVFAVPVFADANSDYLASIKAYQARIDAQNDAYKKFIAAEAARLQARADADNAAYLKSIAAQAAKAQAQTDAGTKAILADAAARQARAVADNAAYLKSLLNK